LAHSSAQALQICAHSAQIAAACSLQRATASAAKLQAAAQSAFRAIQPAIIFTSSSLRQAAKHWLQAVAHDRQASMPDVYQKSNQQVTVLFGCDL
jgi:hypothetical protein